MYKKSALTTGLSKLACAITFLLFSFSQSEAYTVSNLATEYHNGQIFLTWKNPSATNLQYNVYRSLLPFTLSSQLNSSTYLGFVRDSSSKNIFWSQQSKSNVFYKITNDGQPLAGSKGLYVVTCTGSALYYYLVTVTNLSIGNEDKTIGTGNKTLLPVQDLIAQPLPVFQDSFTTTDGDVKQLYVQYVNNQETALYPAMNSTGSYGFNFFVVKRGTATKYPLFIIYEGFGNKDDQPVGLNVSDYTDCYILGLFDWLPIPQEGGGLGDNTFFCCYNENFNIYSNTNPVPTSGVVKLYSYKMYWQAINWLESQVAIDPTRLYLKGTSHNGFGALLAASLDPDKIAAVYCAVEPTVIAASDDISAQMWGNTSSRLKTDRLAWNSTDTLQFNDIKNQAAMLSKNKLRDLPVIYDVHGKQDVTVVWNSSIINWFDSLENNHIGGAWYWDQRDHTSGKDFKDGETQPNFYRFATNISYPAFSNCSVDQNPGTGKPNTGDPYGAINSYLDWQDDNIVDKECNYSIHVFVKDFYVGGVLSPEQHSTCTTDITIRRIQKFLPVPGTTIIWTNFDDATGAKIQTGSFIYDGGLLTIPGLTINKSGNKLKFSIKNCGLRIDDEEGYNDQSIEDILYFSKSPDGYTANIDMKQSEDAHVLIYDLLGRVVWEKKITLTSGRNTIQIPSPATGVFLVHVRCESFSHTEKLFF